MRLLQILLVSVLASTFAVDDSAAGGKKKWKKHKTPPGLAQKGGVPPGLAKKGGLPPGIAKKYAQGDRLSKDMYKILETKYQKHVPYIAPEGRQWVQVGRDLYLLSAVTETVLDVVENWLD